MLDTLMSVDEAIFTRRTCRKLPLGTDRPLGPLSFTRASTPRATRPPPSVSCGYNIGSSPKVMATVAQTSYYYRTG